MMRGRLPTANEKPRPDATDNARTRARPAAAPAHPGARGRQGRQLRALGLVRAVAAVLQPELPVPAAAGAAAELRRGDAGHDRARPLGSSAWAHQRIRLPPGAERDSRATVRVAWEPPRGGLLTSGPASHCLRAPRTAPPPAPRGRRTSCCCRTTRRTACPAARRRSTPPRRSGAARGSRGRDAGLERGRRVYAVSAERLLALGGGDVLGGGPGGEHGAAQQQGRTARAG
jgi:hypothetical protein